MEENAFYPPGSMGGEAHLAAISDALSAQFHAHLNIEPGSLPPEDTALVESVYLPGAWLHCAGFINRDVFVDAYSLAAAAALAEAGTNPALRGPGIGDRRFVLAVFLTAALWFRDREDTPTVPRLAERILWPLRRGLGV